MSPFKPSGLLVVTLSLVTVAALAFPTRARAETSLTKEVIDCFYSLSERRKHADGVEWDVPNKTILSSSRAEDIGLLLVPKKTPGQYYVYYKDNAYEIALSALHNVPGSDPDTRYKLITPDGNYIVLAWDDKDNYLVASMTAFGQALRLDQKAGESQAYPALNARIEVYLELLKKNEEAAFAAIDLNSNLGANWVAIEKAKVRNMNRKALEVCSKVHLKPGVDIGKIARSLMASFPPLANPQYIQGSGSNEEDGTSSSAQL